MMTTDSSITDPIQECLNIYTNVFRKELPSHRESTKNRMKRVGSAKNLIEKVVALNHAAEDPKISKDEKKAFQSQRDRAIERAKNQLESLKKVAAMVEKLKFEPETQRTLAKYEKDTAKRGTVLGEVQMNGGNKTVLLVATTPPVGFFDFFNSPEGIPWKAGSEAIAAKFDWGAFLLAFIVLLRTLFFNKSDTNLTAEMQTFAQEHNARFPKNSAQHIFVHKDAKTHQLCFAKKDGGDLDVDAANQLKKEFNQFETNRNKVFRLAADHIADPGPSKSLNSAHQQDQEEKGAPQGRADDNTSFPLL